MKLFKFILSLCILQSIQSEKKGVSDDEAAKYQQAIYNLGEVLRLSTKEVNPEFSEKRENFKKDEYYHPYNVPLKHKLTGDPLKSSQKERIEYLSQERKKTGNYQLNPYDAIYNDIDAAERHANENERRKKNLELNSALAQKTLEVNPLYRNYSGSVADGHQILDYTPNSILDSDFSSEPEYYLACGIEQGVFYTNEYFQKKGMNYSTWEFCREECRKDPSCHSFSFLEKKRSNQCYFFPYYEKMEYELNSNAISGGRECHGAPNGPAQYLKGKKRVCPVCKSGFTATLPLSSSVCHACVPASQCPNTDKPCILHSDYRKHGIGDTPISFYQAALENVKEQKQKENQKDYYLRIDEGNLMKNPLADVMSETSPFIILPYSATYNRNEKNKREGIVKADSARKSKVVEKKKKKAEKDYNALLQSLSNVHF